VLIESDELTQLRTRITELEGDYSKALTRIANTDDIYAKVKAERDRYREALLRHRSDLHNYSTRPCPTCRNSAEVLGIGDKVPNTCARAHIDKAALEGK
jgi:hypothetical protein